MTLTGSIEMASNKDQKLEFYLKSDDIASLPTTDVPVGSKAYVVDTDAEYTFLGGDWYEKNAQQTPADNTTGTTEENG